MKHQTVAIPADGSCAIGRNVRDVHFEYSDGTRIHYHGKYSDYDSTVNPNDLLALARAAGTSKITGRAVETDYRFITGSTEYIGSYDADGVYSIDYGLE